MVTGSDRFVKIRSPILRAMVDWRDPETPGILRRRRVTLAIITALLAALVILARTGLLPVPARDSLYVLHDYAALPFWGYTWTRFAPYSITWWSLAAFGVAVWLATFLTRRSAVRGLHARLCRFVVHFVADSNRSARHVARLAAWSEWLAARGLGAELLEEVVRLERTNALTSIVGASAFDERDAWRLLRLTDLLARLKSRAGAPPHERWRALALWHQTLMWIDARARTGQRANAHASLFFALSQTGRMLLDRLDAIEDEKGDELSASLRRDLEWLVSAFVSAFALRATAGPAFGRPEQSFMRSVLERLDALWALAERGTDVEATPALMAKASDAVIRVQGILVCSIGLHAASRADDVNLAAANIQAFEALAFVSYLGTSGRDAGRIAMALTAEAPERDHYRLAADIAERRTSFVRRTSAATVGGTVLDEAAKHERIRIDGWSDAAGDDFAERDLRARLQYRIRHRPLPLRTRVDPVLLGGLSAATVVYGVAVATLVLLFGSHFSARWTARALPDRRLIENVRRGLGVAPFLDAVFHAPDRQLVVSQQGGVFHSYDPDTGFWSTRRPFGPTDLARPDVRLLASSSDDRSGALWGVTVDGGLVRRLNGRWEVIVGDTKFLGRRGTAVQHDQLSAVAASSDGRWLLAAAGAEGVGLQDLQRRRWLSPDEFPLDTAPSAVTHAVWWRDRFYVGGPDGVSSLAVDNSTGLAFQAVNGLEGTVVELEPTASDGLFVLQSVSCENGPSGCMRLSRISNLSAAPSVLIDEQNRYTELDPDRFTFAAQWKEHLLLAGGSGIFAYDTRLHSWKRHATETISAIGPCAGESCFFYGYGGGSAGIGLFTPKALTGDAPERWALAGEQPTRIAAGPGRAAVLTAAGRAYAVGPGSPSSLINPANSAPVPIDQYRDAVTFGDKVLFFGAPGALVHDVVRRTYSPLAAAPEWLRSPSSIVAAAGSSLFGLERRGARYDTHVVPQQQVELGTLIFNTSKPFPIDGPIRSIDTSTPDVLRVIDGIGRVQSIAAAGVTPLTGGRSIAAMQGPLLDVAATADALGASIGGTVRLYSMSTRSWSDPLAAPAGERAIEVAERQGTWMARSEANRLVTLGARPSTDIGGGEGMPHRRPNDAFQAGSDLYLSWPGTIQRYDLRSRQVTGTWRFDGRAPARLAGVVGSEPLSLAAGVSRVGAREIARDVRDMLTTGSHVWLTREDRGRRYLEARSFASVAHQASTAAATPSCLFRAAAVGVTAVHDSRRLADGLVAVTTDAGLMTYSADRRSWYGVEGLRPGTGRGSLASIGSTLLVWDDAEERGTLQIVRAAITLPDSCSTARARADRPEVITARAVAIDERANVAYVLRVDGSVDRIDETRTTSAPAERLTSPAGLRLIRGNRWYRRVRAGVWEPAPPSSIDTALADDGCFVWRRHNGSIVVESKAGARVPLSVGPHGLELSTDRLIDAAAYGTGIAVLSDGFIDVAGSLFPAPEGDALDSATIEGQQVLWLARSGSASLWNADRNAFEPAPPNANPLATRTIVASGPLRLTRAGGEIEGALRVAGVQGSVAWMPIDLSRGRFPFDVVRSIAVVGRALYVGTDAGLQIYEETDFALAHSRTIVLHDDGSAGPPAVERVGESCDAPGIAVACGPRGCARGSPTAFAAAPPDALSCRSRVRSPFWSWQVDASGLSGRYAATAVPGARTGAPQVTLALGQLTHDDINQVISSERNLFTVWASRYVAVHSNGLSLADARTHAFDLPVRLLSVTTPVPMLLSRNRELAPGLYAIEGPRTWNYDRGRWRIVTDAAETATIADYDAASPRLQRKRLRLVGSGSGTAPRFEMRMPSQEWTPLAWDSSANRYALDVWHDIAVHQQTLWTATPAGLVSREGDWSFNPDTFRVIETPSNEAGRTATDIRVEDNAALLRYEGSRAYRVSIDASVPHVIRLENDPFAEQTFDVESKYWTWRITGRTGSSAGRLSGTWKGEPIAFANGRFDFDAINSVALFNGLLHIATGTRGWFTLPAGSGSLEGLSRPANVSVAPTEVAKLYGNRDPDSPELCLQSSDRQFARLSPNGSSRRTQGSPVLAARTGFWRYTRDGPALRVLPASGAARPGERRLVDGRFSDEVIVGAPVTGTRNGRTFTLVPTSAAVMWWNEAGQVTDMYAPPFQAKPEVPRLLQWAAGGSPAYLADGTLYSLEDDEKPRGSWTVRLPPKAVLEKLANGPGPLLSIDWSQDGRRHHSVLDPRNGSVSHDEVPIDARRIPAYFQRAMTEASHDGLIRLRLRDHVVSAFGGRGGWPIVEIDDSFQLLAGVSRGRRAILVGPHHLIELNMERIARAVYSGQTPPGPSGSGREK
jgi:hypothetical protein